MNATMWTQRGFWLLLGLSSGLLLSNMTQMPTVAASGSTSLYEDNRMVTGSSFDQQNDVVWLLDYNVGMLHCITINNSGRFLGMGTLDISQQFELRAGSKAKPHFMMVTGKFGAQAIDLCYLAELGSGQMLILAPPGGASQRGGPGVRPVIVERVTFRQGAVRP